MEMQELSEKELLEQIEKIQKKRSRDLKKSGKRMKFSYMYRELLKIKKSNFFAKLNNGKFDEKEIEILKKHDLIKG